MGESLSTIQRSPRISTSHKFAAPHYQLPPMALQTVQASVEPRLSTALKYCSVVPYSSPKISARLRYHVSNSVVFLNRAGTLAKLCSPFNLFSRAEPIHAKRRQTSTWSFLLAWSMPTKCCWWSTAGWPANAKLPLPHLINHSTLLLDRTLKRQVLVLQAIRSLDRLR